MASQRDVKNRIDSVKNIRKITRAMEMVAAARLRRAEQRIAHLRPYASAIRRIASAYGRSAAMRCSARRRRAAATISIARVIFWMFLTEEIRFLTSR